MPNPPLIDIQLFPGPLDVPAAIQRVTCPDAGGIDIFLGTTRAQTDPARGDLVALDYHAYDAMALAELRKIADQAARQWPVVRAVVWHRTGEVPVAEPSVVIAVSCAHRQEAFAACRFIIEELKKLVPIWKKERYTRDSRWQGDAEPPAT